MFTIEVKKRGKDEKFSFEDLEMFHQECYGGKIELESEKRDEYGHKVEHGVSVPEYDGWNLICPRCEDKAWIFKGEKSLMIVQTAIDGEEKKLKNDVRVVQKT